jgi:hypothetical protein
MNASRLSIARVLAPVLVCVSAIGLLSPAVWTDEDTVATLTSPADGQLWSPVMFQWTAVDGAECYYLYVGTTPGARNVVDTGEMTVTSRIVGSLPVGVTLYARIWTKHGGVWRYRDSTFSVQPFAAAMTAPAHGATGVALHGTFSWSAVPNAQTYYLYVGTSIGAKDVVDSGETLETSRPYAGLQPLQTYYARLWTKLGGLWRYVDSSFVTVATAPQPVVATLLAPANDATALTTPTTFQWSSVPGAQAYYLYVGTSPGQSDVVNSGETMEASLVRWLPASQTLYARLWTKAGGVWRYVDSRFFTGSFIPAEVRATLLNPSDGTSDIGPEVDFQWTPVSNVDVYYLYVGTAFGARDIVDSGETKQPWLQAQIPSDFMTLFARLWTKSGGVWRYRDSLFKSRGVRSKFTYPTPGSFAVDPAQGIKWNSIGGAEAYRLQIGTARAAADILDSGDILTTVYAPIGLPTDRTLYARLWTRFAGVWRFDDTVFTYEPLSPQATIVEPSNGEPAFDAAQPFEWTPVALASGYRLEVGSAPGVYDLHDSGEIFVTRRFVRDLPTGVVLYGRLHTRVGSSWRATDFSFTVSSAAADDAVTIDAALDLTAEVRAMADAQNIAWPVTALRRLMAAPVVRVANAGDYTRVLLLGLEQLNTGSAARQLDLTFRPRTRDRHTLAEWQRPDTGTWMLLDPTFALTVNLADGTSATAEAMTLATREQQWTDMSYQFLSPAGDADARAFPIDYPLLYLHVARIGQPIADPLPYLEELTPPASGPWTTYIAACDGGTDAEVTVDGSTMILPCLGPQGTSNSFRAETVSIPGGSTARLFKPRRFVF